METADVNDYVLGSSERELKRLETQAELYSTATREALLACGLQSGMRVLDLGTGAGDVALIAAEIVGDGGAVTGIDISGEAISLASTRAQRVGRAVEFQISPILAFDRYQEFDAVVSRFLLVHIPTPEMVLRDIAARMRRNAILASMEMDMSTASATEALPLFERNIAYIVRLYGALGLSPDMGAKLHRTYKSAGLNPSLSAYTRIGDHKDAAGFEFFAESIRSLMPAIEKLGIATPQEIDIETLSTRLRSEAAAREPAIFYPRFVAAWSCEAEIDRVEAQGPVG